MRATGCWTASGAHSESSKLNAFILDMPGDLLLGSSVAAALEQGARPFRTAARAVRFAMEQAAPVSLRGARLTVGDQVFGPEDIRALHRLLRADRQRPIGRSAAPSRRRAALPARTSEPARIG